MGVGWGGGGRRKGGRVYRNTKKQKRGAKWRFMREIISWETPHWDRHGERGTDIALSTLESARPAGGNYAVQSSFADTLAEHRAIFHFCLAQDVGGC